MVEFRKPVVSRYPAGGKQISTGHLLLNGFTILIHYTNKKEEALPPLFR